MKWTDFTPQQAVEQGLNLSVRLDIEAPLNENGERCPWPWEPEQLTDAPMGQYRCGYCNAMCMAGLPHVDHRERPEDRHLDLLIQLLGYNLVTAVLTDEMAIERAATIAESLIGIDGETAAIRWLILPQEELGGISPILAIGIGKSAMAIDAFRAHTKGVSAP